MQDNRFLLTCEKMQNSLTSHEISLVFEYCGICVYCLGGPQKNHLCGVKYCKRCCLKCEGCGEDICKKCYSYEHRCGNNKILCVRCALCSCKIENNYWDWWKALNEGNN